MQHFGTSPFRSLLTRAGPSTLKTLLLIGMLMPACLFSTASDAGALIRVGPEVPLDAALIGPRLGSSSQPALAKGRSQALVLFTEQVEQGSELRAVRLSNSGDSMDPAPIPISEGQTNLAGDVAFLDGNYVAVWSSADGTEILTRSIAADGSTGPIQTVSVATDPGGLARIAASDQGLMAIWLRQAGAGFELSGRMIDASGQPQGREFLIATSAAPLPVAIAGSIDGFLVSYSAPESGSDLPLMGRRYDETGSSMDSDSFQLISNGVEPAIVESAGTYHVAFASAQGVAGQLGIALIPVPTTGPLPRLPDPEFISPSPTPGIAYRQPSLAAGVDELVASFNLVEVDGSGSLLPQSVLAVRLELDYSNPVPGAVATGSQAASHTHGQAAIASVNNAYRVIWTRTEETRSEHIVGALIDVDTDITVGDIKDLTLGPNAQLRPAVAAGNDGYMAVWKDGRGGRFSIRGLWLDSSGQAIGESFEIEADLTITQPPQVGFHHGRFVLVYAADRQELAGEDGDVVLARTIDSNGVVSDAFVISSQTERFMSSLAIECSESLACLVVWADSVLGGHFSVSASRLGDLDDPKGPTVGANTPLSAPPDGDQIQPAVAAGDERFYVVYSLFAKDSVELYGRPFLETPLLDDPIRIDDSGEDQRQAAVSTDGQQFMVAWLDDAHGDASLVYRRIDGVSGQLIGDAQAVPGVNDAENDGLDLVFDQQHYLLAWSSAGGLSGIRLDADGLIVDASPIQMTPGGLDARLPSLASAAEGRWLTGYQRPEAVERGWLRLVSELVDSVFADGFESENPVPMIQ